MRDGVASRVHVVDPDPEARERAAVLAAKTPDRGSVEVAEYDDVTELANDVAVAVVATGSGIRSQVVTALLATIRVEHLVLEKFLFPRRNEYAQVSELLRTVGTSGWVNTPRRLWPGYQRLRESLDLEAPVSLRIQANPTHGLGSNAVHFVDLFRFLAGEAAVGLGGSPLQGRGLRVIDNQRRRGYIEFDGTLFGSTPRGDHLEITAMPGSTAPLLVAVTCGDEHVLIDEAGGVLMRKGAGSEGWRQDAFVLRLQSELTGQVVRDLAATGRCALPDLEDATEAHLALLGPFLQALDAADEDTPCMVT